MAKRMLIDAVHDDEQRVAVLDGDILLEADFHSSNKSQIKGNVYLARVTRVEPSLQAAFVDFGNGKHGFLPFSEIHPDYFQIPVTDREALIEEAQNADEAFVTSASAFVMPVVEIDGTAIGTGAPGPIAGRLREIYLEESQKTAI